MEQSSQNENSNAKGCETIMAIVIEEKKKTKNPSKNHDSLRIETSINSKKKSSNEKK
jgi:hypothetical protein